MSYDNLILEEHDGVVLLAINRPKALNALNAQTMEELGHFFGEEAPRRKGLRGIIVTGTGEKAFVAGADINEFLDLRADSGARFARRGQEVFFRIEHFPKPVVAAVNGFALGGGCELAMACHLRVAGANARFGQPEVNLGLIPGYGGTQRLVQYVGKTKAMEMVLTGDMIDAEEAQRLGLVNAVTPPGDEVEYARELIRRIAAKGPVAVSQAIQAINAYFNPVADGFQTEVEAFGHCTATEDFREGASAFIEKRKPDFKGK